MAKIEVLYKILPNFSVMSLNKQKNAICTNPLNAIWKLISYHKCITLGIPWKACVICFNFHRALGLVSGDNSIHFSTSRAHRLVFELSVYAGSTELVLTFLQSFVFFIQ